ncbi:MAG: hypothetical protein ACRD0W_00935 [Acidimicrobiales bacterium]
MIRRGQHTVTAAAFHRNGISGNGFNVAIITTGDNRFLVIDFVGAWDESEPAPSEHKGYTAVLDLDQAARGNIFMHPRVDDRGNPVEGTGDNAWRGDVLGDQFREDIRAAINAEHEIRMVNLAKRGKDSTA